MGISVITATYNHAHFLSECVKSIFDQELQPLESIIINDASTDNTLEVIESLRKQYPRIVFLSNEKNLGPARSLNRAISIAKGEYIAGCAADDVLLPGFFSRGIEFLKQHPDLGLCFGDALEFQAEKPDQFQLKKPMNTEKSLVVDSGAAHRFFRRKKIVIPSHSTMYRKSSITDNGGFIPELYSICDWYLNVCIALRSGFGYIPHPFSAYRHTPGSYAKTIYKNSLARKEALDCLFGVLEEERNKDIRTAFRKYGLFAYLNYRFFYDFSKRFNYWYLTWYSFPKKIKFLIAQRLINLKSWIKK